jgi:hypothetical protein
MQILECSMRKRKIFPFTFMLILDFFITILPVLKASEGKQRYDRQLTAITMIEIEVVKYPKHRFAT